MVCHQVDSVWGVPLHWIEVATIPSEEPDLYIILSIYHYQGLLGGCEVLASKEGDEEVDVDCNCHQLGVNQGNVHPTIQQQLPAKDIEILKFVRLMGRPKTCF